MVLKVNKRGFEGHSYIKKFTYDQYLQPYQIDDFLMCLFSNNPHIQVLGSSDKWGTLGKVQKVDAEKLALSVTSLDFFDTLKEHDIVRENGDLVKCFDEYYENFTVSDELRKCLLMEEFDSYQAFTPEQRREFIFQLFKAMCLGGRLCQYEDSVLTYLDVTKKMYKDMTTVVKDPATQSLRVASYVYSVKNVDAAVSPLFPTNHPQNFCFVSVDPLKRHVNVFYHASDAYY